MAFRNEQFRVAISASGRSGLRPDHFCDRTRRAPHRAQPFPGVETTLKKNRFRSSATIRYISLLAACVISQVSAAAVSEVRLHPASSETAEVRESQAYPFKTLETTSDATVSFTIDPAVEIASADFFERYGERFGLSADDTFVLIKTVESETGTVIRFRQHYKGVPVEASYVALVEREGRVVSGTGRIVPGISLDTRPKLDAKSAARKALTAVDNGPNLKASQVGSELLVRRAVWERKDAPAQLAYRFNLRDGEVPVTLLIDASSGETLQIADSRKRALSNITVDPVLTHYDGPVPLKVSESTDLANGAITRRLHRLPANGRPEYQVFCNVFAGLPDYPDAEPFLDTDVDNVFDLPVLCEGTAGTQVMLGIEQTLDLLESVGFKGVDNVGNQPIVAVIDYGNKPSDSSLSYFAKGPLFIGPDIVASALVFHGEPKYTVPGFPGVDMSSVAHELKHAIDAFTGNFESYTACSEGASVEEGSAVVLSGAVQRAFREAQGNIWDWTLFDEYLPTNPQVKIPNLAAPEASGFPGTYGVDASGKPFDPQFFPIPASCVLPEYNQHRNGAIAWKVYRLLSEGGQGVNAAGESYSVIGIGAHKAIELVIWSTLFYPEHGGFVSMRMANLVTAAWRWPGGSEADSIANAWAAVNVGDPATGALDYSPHDGAVDVLPWPAKLAIRLHKDSPVSSHLLQISYFPDFPADPALTYEKALPDEIKDAEDPSYSWVTYHVPVQADMAYYWRVMPTALKPNACPAAPECAIVGLWQPARAFKTAELAIDEIAPASDQVYPWSTEFITGHAPGMEFIELRLCEKVSLLPGGCSAPLLLTLPAATDPPDGKQHAFVNTRVDQVYRWTATAIGPLDAWGQPTKGAALKDGVSYPKTFHTIRPVPTLVKPWDGWTFSPWAIQAQVEPVDGIDQPGISGWCEFVVKGDLGVADTEPKQLVTQPGTWSIEFDVPPPAKTPYYVSAVCFGPELQAPIGVGREETKPSEEHLFIADYELVRPTNLKPFDGEIIPFADQPNTMLFGEWDSVPGADEYVAKVLPPAGGSYAVTKPHKAGNATQKVSLGTGPQLITGNGCWSVRAIKGALQGPESEKTCWKVGPDKPWPLTPANGSTEVPLGVELVFESHFTPTESFLVEVREDSPVGPFAHTHTLTSNDWIDPLDDIHTVVVNLTDDYMEHGKTYCWQVTNPGAPGMGDEVSDWSCFSTSAAPPPQAGDAPVDSMFDPSLGFVDGLLVPDFVNGVVAGWMPKAGADSYIVALGCPVPDLQNPTALLINQDWAAKIVSASDLTADAQQFGSGPMGERLWAVLVTPLVNPGDVGRSCEVGIWPCSGMGTEDFKCGEGHLSEPFMIWGGPNNCPAGYVGWPEGCLAQ